MSDKCADTYKKVFMYIESNVFKLRPAHFMTDFETGMRKAIRECYPDVILHGCWYHFCAAVRRKLLSFNLYQLIVEIPTAMVLYRMLICLPLLPHEFILEGYRIIKEEAKAKKLYKQFSPLFKYFESFWLELVRFADS